MEPCRWSELMACAGSCPRPSAAFRDPAAPCHCLQDTGMPGADGQKLPAGLVCPRREPSSVQPVSPGWPAGRDRRLWLAPESARVPLLSTDPATCEQRALRCNTRETVKLEKIASFECRKISAGWLIPEKYLFLKVKLETEHRAQRNSISIFAFPSSLLLL